MILHDISYNDFCFCMNPAVVWVYDAVSTVRSSYWFLTV